MDNIKLDNDNEKVRVNKEKESDFEIADIFLPLLDKLWLIILVGLVFAIVSAVNSIVTYVPKYTSVGSMYVMVKSNTESMGVEDFSTATNIGNDLTELMYSRSVIETVISDLDLDMTYSTLRNKVAIAPGRFMKVYVTDLDPHQAKRIVDDICEVGAEKIYEYMSVEKVSVVDQGNLPSTPSSSGVANSTVMGGVAGLLTASVIVILLSLLNDQIKAPEDIERFVNLSVLGVIPEFDDVSITSGRSSKKVKPNAKKGQVSGE